MNAHHELDALDGEQIEGKLERLRKLAMDEVSDLVEIIKTHNPLYYVAECALHSTVFRRNGEPLFLPRVFAYFLHLVEKNYVAINWEKKDFNPVIIQRVFDLLKILPMRTMALETLLNEADKRKPFSRISVVQKFQDVFITGKGYYQHKKKIFCGVSEKSNNEEGVIPGASLFYDFFDEVFVENRNRLRKCVKMYSSVLQASENCQSLEEQHKVISAFMETELFACFDVTKYLRKYNKIFDLFALDLNSENSENRYESLPSCGAAYSMHPIWKIGERYFIFNLIEFEDNIYYIYSETLKNRDVHSYKKLLSGRAKYIEETSASVLAKSLNADFVMKNAKYKYNGNEYESDALLGVGNVLFVVEAKSHKFRPATLKGAKLSVEKQLKETIANADSQANRFIEHFKSSKQIELCDVLNKHTISNNLYQKIVKVVVLYEDLSPHVAAVNNLIDAKILDREQIPWVVSLHDLLAVCEIIDRPEIFHLYLDFRLKLNIRGYIAFHDEMEILGFFLSNGYYFPENDGVSYAMQGCSRIVDAYFTRDAEKPSYYVPEYISEIAKSSSNCNFPCWPQFVVSLLSLSKEKQQELEGELRQAQDTMAPQLGGVLIMHYEDFNVAFCYMFDAKEKLDEQPELRHSYDSFFSTIPAANKFYSLFIDICAPMEVIDMFEVEV